LFFYCYFNIYFFIEKLRFGQISCSGRSGTCWQCGVPKWYEIELFCSCKCRKFI